VVQPDNWWYRGVSSTAVLDAILDALEEGEPAQEYLIE
jgi:(2Fe-2S) ferredoxin